MNCTFIGLGNLGKELCGRIGLAGFPTFAYDLNPDASKNAAEQFKNVIQSDLMDACLLYTSPSPRDRTRSRMPSSA